MFFASGLSGDTPLMRFISTLLILTSLFSSPENLSLTLITGYDLYVPFPLLAAITMVPPEKSIDRKYASPVAVTYLGL